MNNTTRIFAAFALAAIFTGCEKSGLEPAGSDIEFPTENYCFVNIRDLTPIGDDIRSMVYEGYRSAPRYILWDGEKAVPFTEKDNKLTFKLLESSEDDAFAIAFFSASALGYEGDCFSIVATGGKGIYGKVLLTYDDGTVRFEQMVKLMSYYEQPLAVDLGLSVKWSDINIGADYPFERGDVFAWGELATYYDPEQPRNWMLDKEFGYDWPSYKFCDNKALEPEMALYKYCTNNVYGTVDNKRVLDLTDDVAHTVLGGNWRMPTVTEMQELIEECTWTHEKKRIDNRIDYDVYRVTGPNGNHIIIAKAMGMKKLKTETASSGNSAACLWTSSLHSDYSVYAYYLLARDDSKKISYTERPTGYAVRPVMPK